MFVPDSQDFVRIFPDFFTETPAFFRGPRDHAVAFLRGLRVEHRDAGTDDPSLLPGDLPQRMPQVFHVVKTNGRDHAHCRIFHRAGGVKPASQPRLQDRVLCPRFRKCQKRHTQQEFKKCRMGKPFPFHTLHCFPCLIEHSAELSVTDLLPADHDALVHLHQVRGRKKPRPFSLRTEHSVEIRAHRAFPVRPGHMDHLHMILRVPETGKKSPGVLSVIFLCEFRDFQYIIYRLLICHSSCSSSRSSSCSTNA